MIDLHSHIIPEIDDGASDFEEAVNMLKIAEKDGVRTIVATPHVFCDRSEIKDLEKIPEEFKKFKEKVKGFELNIEILQGAENYFVSDLRERLNSFSNILTINKSDYFLVEFPFEFIFPGIKEFIFNIMTDGFIPIICHPERNREFQRNPGLLYEFLKIGALSQVNAGSFKGIYGTEVRLAAYDLLKFNLVHIIASDCHNLEDKEPGLSFLYEKLKVIQKEKIDMLVKIIPGSIISNKPIPDIGTMKDPNAKISFFDLFRRKLK
jgi:protein-tyrosine phosphatase